MATVDLAVAWNPVFRHLGSYLSGLRITIEVSVAAFAGSLLLGVACAAGRRGRLLPVRFVTTAYVEVFRNTPLLLQIFVAFFGLPAVGVPLTRFEAGILALALNAGAYLTETIRGGLASVPLGQQDAAKVLSLGRFDTFSRVILPQALRNVYPPMINQFIQVVLGSSLLSAIALPELTGVAETINSETLLTLQSFTVALVAYLLVSNAISVLAQLFAAAVFHPPLETVAVTRRPGWMSRRQVGLRPESTGGASTEQEVSA